MSSHILILRQLQEQEELSRQEETEDIPKEKWLRTVQPEQSSSCIRGALVGPRRSMTFACTYISYMIGSVKMRSKTSQLYS